MTTTTQSDPLGVDDRVIVRIDYRDEPGTVTRLKPRNQYVVVTDSGDCRTWDRHQIRREPR